MTTHLALLDPLSRHGGMHYYDHDLANALVRQGLVVDVFSPPTGLEAGAVYRMNSCFEGVYGAGKGSRLRRAGSLLCDTINALRRARDAGCKIVLIHIFKFDIFEYLLVRGSQALGMKCQAIVHDVVRLDAKTLFDFHNWIVTHIDGLIVHNSYSWDELILAAPCAAEKTIVMRHGNYVEHFPDLPTMQEAREQLGLPQEKKILLFFGNPRREKGLHLLLEALSPLRHEENLILLIAGKMKLEDERMLRAKIEADGLLEHVRLDIGHVPDEKMAAYFRAASVVVLPYLRIYESGVALMAMSFARAILASDLPVFRDLTAEGADIRLFVANDAASLKEALQQFIDEGCDWEERGRDARRFVVEKRNWDQSAYALLQAGTIFKR